MDEQQKGTPDRYFRIHSRFTNDEYLIDFRTYDYILDYIEQTHESIHLLPDDEYIEARKLIDENPQDASRIKLNEVVFE